MAWVFGSGWNVAVAASAVPGSKEIAVADSQDRRKRSVKGGQGREKGPHIWIGHRKIETVKAFIWYSWSL